METEVTVNQKDLEQKVKEMYRDVALNPDEDYHFEMGRSLAQRLGYPTELLNQIPESSIASFAGVGYFFDLADLKADEVVVDLGSGSGMDSFYSAIEVGHKGEVKGLDMTVHQLEKANALKEEGGFGQVEFKESYIENLAIPSSSADVVISNGVINLSSNKKAVFEEIARILKPGGRLVLADIVSTKSLPENISGNATLWASCIGGATQWDAYLELMESAGLKVVTTKQNPYQFISKSAQSATEDYGIKSISLLATKV